MTQRLVFVFFIGVWSSMTRALPEQDDLPFSTEVREVRVISEEEFDPAVRRLPGLVEKLQTEMLAAQSPHVLLPHRPNYFLPATWYSRPSTEFLEQTINQYADEPIEVPGSYDHLEAVIQLSLKYVIAQGLFGELNSLALAYTNKSFWQTYNTDISRPFRETNHEPEIVLSWGLKDAWLDYLTLSLNHQSNGQTGALSRSWNRIIGETGFILGDGIVRTRLWWRIPETSKADPTDPKDNDNPDITHFLGHGELHYVHLMRSHQFSLMVRNNLDAAENRGAVELGYTFPLTRRLKGYVQYFDGYGDSLIDYNRYQQRVGLGIKLTDWF